MYVCYVCMYVYIIRWDIHILYTEYSWDKDDGLTWLVMVKQINNMFDHMIFIAYVYIYIYIYVNM